MQYYRCQCGKSEMWNSGEAVRECEGCAECRTTFAQHPADHKPLAEHDWEPRYNERTGEPDKRMCRRCYASEKSPAP